MKIRRVFTETIGVAALICYQIIVLQWSLWCLAGSSSLLQMKGFFPEMWGVMTAVLPIAWVARRVPERWISVFALGCTIGAVLWIGSHVELGFLPVQKNNWPSWFLMARFLLGVGGAAAFVRMGNVMAQASSQDHALRRGYILIVLMFLAMGLGVSGFFQLIFFRSGSQPIVIGGILTLFFVTALEEVTKVIERSHFLESQEVKPSSLVPLLSCFCLVLFLVSACWAPGTLIDQTTYFTSPGGIRFFEFGYQFGLFFGGGLLFVLFFFKSQPFFFLMSYSLAFIAAILLLISSQYVGVCAFLLAMGTASKLFGLIYIGIYLFYKQFSFCWPFAVMSICAGLMVRQEVLQGIVPHYFWKNMRALGWTVSEKTCQGSWILILAALVSGLLFVIFLWSNRKDKKDVLQCPEGESRPLP